MTAAASGRIPAWTVADRLRKARESAELDQIELARMIGVSRNTVGNYETGRVEPRKIVLNAWSLATGVSRQWLLDGTIPPDGPLAQSEELRTFNPKSAIPTPLRRLARSSLAPTPSAA